MKVRNTIANVSIVILGVIIAFMAVSTVFMMVSRNNWDQTDEVSLLREIERGDYIYLAHEIFRCPEIEDSEIYDQCKAIASYYLAASVYHTYEQTGDKEQAAYYKGQMDDQLAKFGDLYFIEYEINEQLGIQ